jgi:peptidoglycan/LPS O-acetylase OafA/YrhL
MSPEPVSKRIAALDGWRGGAILLVLFSHIQDSLLRHYLWPWSATGYRGVSIYFVLSGFLITSKLIESGDLKRFYVRRFFRLMPAAWVYLGLMLILWRITGKPYTTPSEVLACVFFYRNFLGFIGEAGHFWSLSIEEQFYLLWPSLLLFAGKRRAVWIAAAGAVGSAVARAIPWTHAHVVPPVKPTWLVADGLLLGCLFVLIASDPVSRERLARFSRICVVPALLIYLCCAVFLPQGQASFIEHLCIGLLISATVLHPGSLIARVISFGPLTWFGRISYSVYLWQEVFMPFRNPLILCTLFPAFALASYYLIENPLTKLGHRLTSRRAPVRDDRLEVDPLRTAETVPIRAD